jgi:RNA polymerase-binding transcription factor DksA
MDPNVARRRLEAEWERLLQARDAVEQEHLSTESQDESTGELSPIDQHQADAGSDVFEREKDFTIRDQIDDDLGAVQDAFVRLQRGSYGRCATCGTDIPESRLSAMPTARFCVEHERLWELHSMTVSFPDAPYPYGAASAEHLAEQEAIQHLEFLPDEDEPEEMVELSAEEAAMHTQPGEQ